MSNIIDLVNRLKEKQEIAPKMEDFDLSFDKVHESLLRLERIIDHHYKLYFKLPIDPDLQSLKYSDCDSYLTSVYVNVIMYTEKHQDETGIDVCTKLQSILAVNIGRCFVIRNRKLKMPSDISYMDDSTERFKHISNIIAQINLAADIQK
jgi:hypothetical protein